MRSGTPRASGEVSRNTAHTVYTAEDARQALLAATHKTVHELEQDWHASLP